MASYGLLLLRVIQSDQRARIKYRRVVDDLKWIHSLLFDEHIPMFSLKLTGFFFFFF